MSEDREQIAKRLHKHYEPDDKSCSWRDKDWDIAKEIALLQSQFAIVQKEIETLQTFKSLAVNMYPRQMSLVFGAQVAETLKKKTS